MISATSFKTPLKIFTEIRPRPRLAVNTTVTLLAAMTCLICHGRLHNENLQQDITYKSTSNVCPTGHEKTVGSCALQKAFQHNNEQRMSFERLSATIFK